MPPRLDLLNCKDDSYAFQPIAQHDSWLSIDPIVGCRMSCAYCYMQSSHWTGVVPQRLASLDEILSALLRHKYFVPHETVLSFGNHTDPFLDDNIDYLSAFLEALEAAKYRNPVAIVTKRLVPSWFAKRAAHFQHLRMIFCISYSGLPGGIERGVNARDAEENFHALGDGNHRVIHFWRPIVEDNSRSEIVERVLHEVVGRAAASVYVGLKLTPELRRMYPPGLVTPSVDNQPFGEALSPGLEYRLRSIAAKSYPDHPLYRHTSCAVSLVLGIKDYNATFEQSDICGSANCPSAKRKICAARSCPSAEEVVRAFERVGYRGGWFYEADAIHLRDEVTQQDYAFLLHRLGVSIEAKIARDRNVWGSIFDRGRRRLPLTSGCSTTNG